MTTRRNQILTLLSAGALAAVLVGAAGCNDSSNMVTNPGPAAASVNVAGTWSGTFRSGVPGCSAAPMLATLSQNGATVTGNIAASSCGLTGGHFNGTLTGHQLTGSIGMMGCTGGAVSGTVNANGSQISFSMDDLKKPLVTGDQVIAPGGDVTLSR